MIKNVFFILLALLVFNCSSDNGDSQNVTVESTLISKGNLYGDGAEGIAQQNLHITDETTWTGLVAQMNSVNNVSNGFSELAIDFSMYDVIAVFDEIKVNGGHALALDIASTTESIVVTVTDLSPEGGVLPVITQPYHIVKIPKSSLPVVFE